MRKLTQKELANEGIGSFLKNVGKGAAVVAGKALKGVAKAVSPTAYGLAQQAGKALKDTDQAVRAATTTLEDRIKQYFQGQSYKVKSINPGGTRDTKVVKVSEIVYDNQGKGTEVPEPSPFVVKVSKQGVEVVRGPKKTPRGEQGDAAAQSQPEAQSQPAAPAQTQPTTQTQPAAQAQPAKPAAKPVTPPAAQTATPPAAAAAGARGQQGTRGAKSESPAAAKKRIARAIKSNRPPSKSDIEMLKKAGIKDKQTIGGVTFKNLKRRTKLAESRKSQKNLLKHLHYGSQMNK